MIGIIGAMEIEIAGLIKKMTDVKKIKSGKISVFTGKIGDKAVAAARCGVGKVSAAAVAAFLTERFKALGLIINLGVAGGIKPDIKQGDFVVASAAVQHDYDLTPDGYIIGTVEGYANREFTCDQAAADKMCQILKKLGYAFQRGVIASGDQFIKSKEKSAWLREEFNAYACDMETAAVAHVCDIFGKKFLGVRSMSDNADGGAIEDFYAFAEKAAARSINAVCAFLE